MDDDRIYKLKQKAKNDYLELVEKVTSYNGTFSELNKELNGFNEQPDYKAFDVNYGCLTATVYSENGNMFVYEFIDVWDDEYETQLFDSIIYTYLFE